MCVCVCVCVCGVCVASNLIHVRIQSQLTMCNTGNIQVSTSESVVYSMCSESDVGRCHTAILALQERKIPHATD